MSIKIVPVNGTTVDGIELNTSGATITGSGAVLADGSDATRIENAGGGLDYNVRIAPLADYQPGDPISLHIRLSLTTDGAVGVDGRTYLFLQDGNPTETSGQFYVGQFTNSHWNVPGTVPPPFDGTIRDLTFSLIPRPAGTGAGYGVAGTTVADCLAVLASGDGWLNVNSLESYDGSGIVGRIYEAWIEVGETILSPCFQTLTATTQSHWADDDDGTSVTLGVVGSTYSELSEYGARSILDITATFRASSTEATDSTIDSIELGDAWDGTTFRNLASSGPVSIPNDGAVRDYSVTLTFVEDAATIRDALDIAENAVLMFNTSSARDVFIHEASLRVGHKCVVNAPPCQIYPRDDGQGAGGAAIWPPPSSGRPGSYY